MNLIKGVIYNERIRSQKDRNIHKAMLTLVNCGKNVFTAA